MNYLRYLLLLVLSTSIACKSAKAPVRPAASYEALKTSELSRINIPVSLNIQQMETALNDEIDAIFAGDNQLFGGNQKDFDLKVSKSERLTLDISPNIVSYSVPLNLLIKKDVGIANLNADGSITLDFTTNFTIQPDWTLATETKLATYKWIKKPQLDLGFIRLPIESVANRLVEQSKGNIAKIIDAQIRENFVLRDYVNEAWLKLQQPIPASIENQLWVRMKPRSIGMTSINKKDARINATIVIETIAEANMGQRPVIDTILPLPAFTPITKTGGDFKINLFTSIPMDTLRNLVSTQVIGETYTGGNRTVTVKDLELYGQGNKIVVNMSLTGDYNGNVYMIGTPFYNEKKNQLEIDDLDYELSSKNFMQKSLGWLFKKNIEKRIESSLRFPLDENLEIIKETLDKSLEHYPITSGIVLKGNLEDLKLGQTYVSESAIHVVISSGGQLNLELKDLAKLNEL